MNNILNGLSQPEAELMRTAGVGLKIAEYMNNPTEEGYDCIMRKLSEVLHGKHYTEELARADVRKISYTDKSGVEHCGAHWTVEQIETATANKTFPTGTTKWDKYVAYNAFYADLCTVLTDDQIIAAAYLFWFADEDWKSKGKIWDYMGANK